MMDKSFFMLGNEVILDEMFHDWRQYKEDGIVLSVSRYDYEEEPIAFHLIYKSDKAEEKFLQAQADGISFEDGPCQDDELCRDYYLNVSVFSRINPRGRGYDLVFRFNFFFHEGGRDMELLIAGDDPENQQRFIGALRQIDQFYLWVLTPSGSSLRVIPLSWEFEAHQEVWDKFML